MDSMNNMASASGSANVLITLFVFIIVITGTIVLQVFLSRKQNKWLGLILPFTCLFISLSAILGVAAFSSMPSVMITVISVFLLYNIPTVILVAIYYACREKLRRAKEINKMNIQDLE